MSDEIINRVANSSLEVVDLEELYVEGIRNLILIENFLDEGGVLIESKFREKLNSFNWSIYSNNYVAVYCSKEILVPKWAELLFINYLSPYVKDVVIGNTTLLASLYNEGLLLGHALSQRIYVQSRAAGSHQSSASWRVGEHN